MDGGILCRWVFTRSSRRVSLARFVPISSPRIFASAIVSSVLVGVGALVAGRVPASAAERSEAVGQAGLVTFDIAAQPLDSALESYGAATMVDVFYDSALAAGRWSAGVKGLMEPARALEILLHGTGYARRVTGPGVISIVPAAKPTVQQTIALKRSLDRYDPFFAILQKRLSRILCRDDHAEVRSGEIILKFWISASGVIARTEIIASGGDPERDNTIAKRVDGLDVGEPPPAGLPEPVIMAVFPPVEGEAPECPPSRDASRH
jgi:hypothetical protein